MQPDKIEIKRLKLVGVEMYISEEEDFGYNIEAMRAEIKNRWDGIQNRSNK